MKKIFNWIRNLFKGKLIVIPLTTNGVKNGLWVECRKGDKTYKKLVKIYGKPLPTSIETEPYKEENI